MSSTCANTVEMFLNIIDKLPSNQERIDIWLILFLMNLSNNCLQGEWKFIDFVCLMNNNEYYSKTFITEKKIQSLNIIVCSLKVGGVDLQTRHNRPSTKIIHLAKIV